MGDYPERHPLYGAINEDQQWVIDKHLKDAESVGVTAFAVNWYRDDYLSYALNRMEQSTVPTTIKYCIQWSNHYTSMSPTAANKPYLFEGIRRAALRMNAPNYWSKAGKPVFILFSAAHLDDVIRVSAGQPVSYTPSLSERNLLITDIRNIVGNVLTGNSTGGISGSTVAASANPGPYLVLMTTDSGWYQVTGVEAFTNYNTRTGTYSDGVRYAHNFNELALAARQSWGSGHYNARIYNKKHWPCVMAGFDQKPWGGTTSDPLNDNCLPTTEAFIGHCWDAKVMANHSTADNTVFLYAWNEFGEGGWIQPTPLIGTKLLDAVKILTE